MRTTGAPPMSWSRESSQEADPSSGSASTCLVLGDRLFRDGAAQVETEVLHLVRGEDLPRLGALQHLVDAGDQCDDEFVPQLFPRNLGWCDECGLCHETDLTLHRIAQTAPWVI